MDPLRIWWEAAAEVESELAAEVAEEAYEVFVAEAARVRLVDRRGHVRVHLHSGASVAGDLLVDVDMAEHLAIREASGATSLVTVSAIVSMRGSHVVLRPTDPDGASPGSSLDQRGTSIGSWLRRIGQEGAVIRVLLRDGVVIVGTVEMVARDHVELVELGSAESVVVPFAAVECWTIPPGLG